MRKVKIITDSTADLSKELINELDIEVLPLGVNFGDDFYKDGVDIDTKTLYELVEKNGELPKTSAISPGVFILEFEKWINEGYDVIYLGIGSTISGTFQSAMVAKSEFSDDNVFLVDSKNLSSGIALLVLKAVKFRNEGLSAKEIKERLEKLVPLVRSQFAIKVLDYLHKGGRASGTQALVGKVLRIRPIIKVNDGVLDVYKKPMGTMIKACDIMLNDFLDLVKMGKVDLENVMITHSFAEKQSIYMQEFLKTNNVLVENLYISEAGCVISSHCGSGTIGILYIVNE